MVRVHEHADRHSGQLHCTCADSEGEDEIPTPAQGSRAVDRPGVVGRDMAASPRDVYAPDDSSQVVERTEERAIGDVGDQHGERGAATIVQRQETRRL